LSVSPIKEQRGVVSICGYGPSLAETWGQVIGPVMTTSGAHDFMLSKGVVPAYHCETDPREHKAWFLSSPNAKTTYLINSQCHPKMFANLAGHKVVLWHGITDDDAKRQALLVDSLQPGAKLLCGGTTVGMRAIVVARALGFTHFELHGMDCCYRGPVQWAGSHYSGMHHRTVRVEVEGEEFETSDLMMQSTDDLFNAMRMLPGCRFRVHGNGLLEARLRLFNKDPERALSVGWFKPVNFTIREAA